MTAVAAAEAAPRQKRYGVSAMLSGFRVIGRAWVSLLVVVVVHAVVQAGLVWMVPVETAGDVAVTVSLAVSLAAALLLYLWVARAVLGGVDGRVPAGSVFRSNGSVAGRFMLWTLAEAALILAGFLLAGWVGLVVLVALVYVPFVVLDGARVPFVANFRTIGQRPARYVLTLVVQAVVFVVVGAGMGLVSALFPTPLAPFFDWLVKGFLLAWFLAAFALVYRSTGDGAADAREPAA